MKCKASGQVTSIIIKGDEKKVYCPQCDKTWTVATEAGRDQLITKIPEHTIVINYGTWTPKGV